MQSQTEALGEHMSERNMSASDIIASNLLPAHCEGRVLVHEGLRHCGFQLGPYLHGNQIPHRKLQQVMHGFDPHLEWE